METMVIYLYKMLLNWYEKVGKYTNVDDIVATTEMDNMDAAILADKMRYQNCWNNETVAAVVMEKSAFWKML